jgi:5'(3')-deoxyribonucleotidase/uncharacterized protein with PQ loop repeat
MAAALGTVAALCTTLAFVPQLFRIRRNGSAELSSAMLAIYLAGLALWLAYGVVIHALPVIGANVASLAIVSAVTARKLLAARAASAATRRLRIAIDMDEVMADALTEHLRRYNAAFGESLTPADLHGHHLEDFVPAERLGALEAMLDASFFADLEVMPDCQEVVRELAARHDVYIVTAAMDVPSSFDAKFRWLQQYFPFIPPSQIVFCGDKGIIEADFLIDDRARHFGRFRGRPLLYSAPHNADEMRYPRVSSWQDVREVFDAIDGGSRERRESARLSGEPAAA